MAALLGIEDFMRKIAAEEKGFTTAFFYRGTETVIVAVESDEDSSLAQMLLEIVAGLLAPFRPAEKIAFKVQLNVAVVIGAIEPVHHERNPGCATFEESDTKFRKAFEYPMCQHARRLDHQTEGMAQGMSRVVGAEGIESHVMKTAHVYGQRAAEFLRLLVKRPVDLVS